MTPLSPHRGARTGVTAARPKSRASTASREGRRPFHNPELWPDTVLTALARAWTVTIIATTLLFAVLAIAPMWDGAIFRQALRDALRADPELAQPVDEAAADAPAGCETSSPSTVTCQASSGPAATTSRSGPTENRWLPRLSDAAGKSSNATPQGGEGVSAAALASFSRGNSAKLHVVPVHSASA